MRRSRWRHCRAALAMTSAAVLGLAPTLEPALAAIAAGRSRQVDVLAVNGIRVLTVAGLGVVSSSALQVGRLARRGHVARPIVRAFGSLAYLGAAGARLLLEPRLARHATVRWRATADADWQQVDGRFYGIFLACRPASGSGPPPASLRDARRWPVRDRAGRKSRASVRRDAAAETAQRASRATGHALDSSGIIGGDRVAGRHGDRRRWRGPGARPRPSKRACCLTRP